MILSVALCLLTPAKSVLVQQPPHSVESHPGTYRQNATYFTRSEIDPAVLRHRKEVHDRLHSLAGLVKQAYPNPTGCSLSWSQIWSSPECTTLKGFPCTYNRWYVQPFFWDKGAKRFELDETPMLVYEMVNGLPKELATKVMLPQSDSNHDKVQAKIAGEPLYLFSPATLEQVQGLTAYSIEEGSSLPFQSVIVTKSSKPLFHPVSRGQCLDFMAELSRIERKIEGPVGASRFDTIDQGIKTYRDKLSADELKQPAIIAQSNLQCDLPAQALDFNTPLFREPDKGYSVVAINTSYFDKAKGAESPQFISISWNYFSQRKWSQRFNDAMRTKFNFAVVRKMLVP